MVKLIIIIKDLKYKETKLEIDSSETIGNGKKLYIKLLNLSGSFQWKFGGMLLNDNKTFDYYGIEDYDVIISNNLKKKIRIHIKNLKGFSTELEVDASETIAFGKKIYANLINNHENYMWKFDGMVLWDGNTFESYGIEDGDVISINSIVRGGCLNKN